MLCKTQPSLLATPTFQISTKRQRHEKDDNFLFRTKMEEISLILHGTQEAPADFSRSEGKRLYNDETDEDFREKHDEWRIVRN